MTTPRRLAETAADITPKSMLDLGRLEFIFRDSECKELTNIYHLEHVSHFYDDDGRYVQACYTANAICAKEEDEFISFDMSVSCGAECIETPFTALPPVKDTCAPDEYQNRMYKEGTKCDIYQALGALPKTDIFEGTRDDHIE